MATPENNRSRSEGRPDMDAPNSELQSSRPFDLPDSAADREKLKPEETVINLPDVSDIPGQENVTVPNMGYFADTTASSDDEEGISVFGDDRDFDDTTARTSEGQDDNNVGGNIVEGTP